MKVTAEMVWRFADTSEIGEGAAHYIRAGLERALKDVPEVEPFAHPGYPKNPVYIHPPCGTALDIDPAMNGIEGSVNAQIEAGECDCENTSPWLRIYVEKQEKR